MIARSTLRHDRVFFALLAFIFAASLSAMASEGSVASSAKLSRGPYLQMATPDSIVIVWRTEGDSIPKVRWGTAQDQLTNEVGAEAIMTRVSVDVIAPEGVPRLYNISAEEEAKRAETRRSPASTIPGTHQYEARIMGLNPNARYYYAVYNGNTKLAGGDSDHYFRTLPSIGGEAPARIWVVGDSGTAGLQQKQVFQAMQDRIAKD